jgi:ribonuclease HI
VPAGTLSSGASGDSRRSKRRIQGEEDGVKEPQTLVELLRLLERSGELRGLARDCGLSVRELRRRLAGWRVELESDDGGPRNRDEDGETRGDKPAARVADSERWPELPSARDVKGNPLPATGSRILVVRTDGASKGNPGPAAIGAVFSQADGPELCGLAERIGRATNNVAEYTAVVRALELCLAWGVGNVELRVDSELVARQLQGVYRVKSPSLRPLYQRVVFLARSLASFSVKHVPREQNAHADHLANAALKVPPQR